MNFRFFRGVDGPEREAPGRGSAQHQVAWIDADLAAIANDDHTAIRGEKFQIGRKVHVGQHFKNNVHTAAAGCPQYLFLITRLAVFENLMRALAFCEAETFLRSGRAEDGEAYGSRHLHCRGADSAARSMYQDGFG